MRPSAGWLAIPPDTFLSCGAPVNQRPALRQRVAETERKVFMAKKKATPAGTVGKGGVNPAPVADNHTVRVAAEQLVLLPIDDLVPYANNAKIHTPEQISKIRGSLREFGFVTPILVDFDNNIIAGHGRVMAARAEGMTEVPCVMVSNLTEAQRKAYILADNRMSEIAEWDVKALEIELQGLKDMEFDTGLIGFEPEDLKTIEVGSYTRAAPGQANFEPDSVEVVEDNYDCTAPDRTWVAYGDVFKLGRHRLMCGDSTKEISVKFLLDGNPVDLLFTDPPYNVAFNGRSGKFEVIENDNLSAEAFEDFIERVCNVIKLINPEHYYIWCNWKFYATLQTKLRFKSCIVWAKNVFGLGSGYRHQHEFCLFNGAIDKDVTDESDLWEISRDSKYVHPTQKPIALCARALKNHKCAKHVLDLFGGSGSTLIACEQMGRTCYTMELDPKYVEVIINRWEALTGQKAVKVNG